MVGCLILIFILLPTVLYEPGSIVILHHQDLHLHLLHQTWFLFNHLFLHLLISHPTGCGKISGSHLTQPLLPSHWSQLLVTGHDLLLLDLLNQLNLIHWGILIPPISELFWELYLLSELLLFWVSWHIHKLWLKGRVHLWEYLALGVYWSVVSESDKPLLFSSYHNWLSHTPHLKTIVELIHGWKGNLPTWTLISCVHLSCSIVYLHWLLWVWSHMEYLFWFWTFTLYPYSLLCHHSFPGSRFLSIGTI